LQSWIGKDNEDGRFRGQSFQERCGLGDRLLWLPRLPHFPSGGERGGVQVDEGRGDEFGAGGAAGRRNRHPDPVADGSGGAEQLRRLLSLIPSGGHTGQAIQGVGDDHLVVDAVRERKTRSEERHGPRRVPAGQRQRGQAVARLGRGAVVAEVVQQLPRLLVVFLYAVQPGAADRAYGIQVARLAGLPSWVADRAETLLADATRETATERAIAEDRAIGGRNAPSLHRQPRIRPRLSNWPTSCGRSI
jgi:hypothetical protein